MRRENPMAPIAPHRHHSQAWIANKTLRIIRRERYAATESPQRDNLLHFPRRIDAINLPYFPARPDVPFAIDGHTFRMIHPGRKHLESIAWNFRAHGMCDARILINTVL